MLRAFQFQDNLNWLLSLKLNEVFVNTDFHKKVIIGNVVQDMLNCFSSYLLCYIIFYFDDLNLFKNYKKPNLQGYT